SATGAHRWSSDFGNRRVMDTWAFYPSSVLQVPGLVRLNEADLAVVKTADRSTIAAGSTIGYTIVVTNNGPSNVTNAPFSDNVPATLTNVSWSCTASNGSSCGTANGTGNNISVPLNLLNAGTATIRVTAVVNPTATGTITNTAQILRPNDVTDPDDPGRTGAADNSEPEAITIVAPVTNVVGQKSVRFVADNDTSGTVTVNDEVEYTVTYSNTGANVNSDVINFVINDALPSQLSFVAGSAAIVSQTTGNNITLNPNYNGAGVTALTTLVSGTSAGNSSTLRIGDTITIRFRARINNANNGNPIDNQAIAQHTVPGNATVQNVLSDADAAGGTSTAPALNAAFSQVADDGANTGNAASTADDDPTRITVVPAPLSPNVSGTKSIRFLEDRDNTNSVTVGDVVEYLITYTNQTPIGTADATNFVINEPLPPQLTYVAGSAAIVSQTAGNAITLNSAYNGTGALTNSGTLRLEDTIVIRVRATINSANNGNAISNQATATFNSAANATTRTVLTDADSAGGTSNTPAVNNPFLQTADDGVNTGNNPANTADDDPTLFRVVTPATAPSVVGRKSVRFVADNDTSGTVTLGDTVEYSITYNNLAPAATADALNFVINETLPAQLTYLANSATITNLTTGNTIALVSGYNGSGALTSSGTLRLNDTITITLRATINSINAGNPIPNQATATFSSASNPATQTVLTDADAAGGSSNAPAVNSAFLQTNDDGANTGNNPANTADDDPTLIRAVAGPTANLRLVKRITRLNATAFTEVLDDPSDPNDDAIRNWPAGYLQGRINRGVGTDVVSPFPGDELEYTIYFLSDGTRDISNLNLCDLVPLNTTLVANAFNGLPVAPGGIGGDRGVAIDLNGSTLGYSNGADGDRASFYQVGTSVPVPSGAAAPAPCQAFNTAANGNGAVVINLPSLPRSTAPGAPTTSYGFVRFRVRVR
ncbi:MAG: isopeptide-forming domain-containing fimbrial protein, partial [Leptolyngbyaceae cyanobacterium bins.59]|nr:isopeptide-forming domain-containing fimbrial protein [Leptolyngbyaceae cyanobacterium bins.59]